MVLGNGCQEKFRVSDMFQALDGKFSGMPRWLQALAGRAPRCPRTPVLGVCSLDNLLLLRVGRVCGSDERAAA